MVSLIVIVFVLGYLAIALESLIRLNKAASALLTAVLCWTIYILSSGNPHPVNEELTAHLGSVAEILFFLLGAMTIVELIDAHDGFEVITARIRTTSSVRLLWTISLIAFFLSAVLDNLTTAIVMVSLTRKIIADQKSRLLFSGIIVLAANAGGAWSPIGDVTTTMLWIGGQITTVSVIREVFLPSLVSLLVPLLFVSYGLRGVAVERPAIPDQGANPLSSRQDRNLVFFTGVVILLLIPVFKTVTHLPPYMGMLMGLGVIWMVTEIIHSRKDEQDKHFLSVMYAIRKIDTPSILFFLGILLSVASLESIGVLQQAASWLETTIGNSLVIVSLIGMLSAVVDNVPLVAASMAMYPLEQYPADDFFWHFMAYCTGTGGSLLIIGSAAGVAAMGIEKIEFFWYLRRITWLALLGYLSGIAVFGVEYLLTR